MLLLQGRLSTGNPLGEKGFGTPYVLTRAHRERNIANPTNGVVILR